MSPAAPRRPSAKRAAVEASAHLQRSQAWNGLRSGDPVVVAGVKVRGATWEFRAHILNQRNGDESIEVVGGRPGARKIRSFEPDRIFPVTGRRTRSGRSNGLPVGQLSLADAPQLPFG
jgi:hypothetical protein